MLEAVIFDMDGVIVDTHPVHREAWRLFLLSLGRVVSDGELDFVLDGRKRGEILRHFLGTLSDSEVHKYGERKDEYFKKASLEVNPLPGVLKFLRTLVKAGIATAVATSASESRTRHTLERLRLSDKISTVITGDDVELGKPDPSVYILACERLDVSPRNALAIEDAVSGIQAARGAGLNCIGVASHESAGKLRAVGAAYVVKDFRNLSLSRLQRCLPHSQPGDASGGIVQRPQTKSGICSA